MIASASADPRRLLYEPRGSSLCVVFTSRPVMRADIGETLDNRVVWCMTAVG